MTLPNTFVNGTLTDADDVNENFTFLDDKIDTPISQVTSYYTINGIAFYPTQEVEADSRFDLKRVVKNASRYYCPINLPNGAIITASVVYGNMTRTWILARKPLNLGATDTMATAATGTEDTTISNEVIDNTAYSYAIYYPNSLVINDEIYGARITYTI